MDYGRQVSRLFKLRWRRLDRAALDDPQLARPGVYVISISSRALSGATVTEELVHYVGMTVSVGGLRHRLRAFLRGSQGVVGHSGGYRLSSLRRRSHAISFAAQPLDAETHKDDRTSNDLRTMGHIACLEYYLLAHIKKCVGKEPQLNRK